MSDKPNIAVRIWRAVRNFVSALFGPDQANDARLTHSGQIHPRQEQQGRTFSGGLGG